MALRGAIASLTQGGPYSLTRRAAGTYVNGNYVPAVGTTTVTVAGSLQPVTGRELRDLSEAQRGDEIRVLYTLTKIYTREPGFDPDTISIGGEAWTCIKVEQFDAFGETHYRAYFARSARP